MNTNGKLYIIDDNYLVAESIKQAFQGKIVEISDEQKWLIIEDNIKILPNNENNDLSKIIDILNKDRNNIELVLVNANLKLDESDKRIDKRGIRLTELIRMNPDLKFPIILMSVENSSKILKDARYNQLLKFCCQQIIIQIPFQIFEGNNSLFENINNLYKRISETPEKKREKERETLAKKLLSEEMEKMNHVFRHSFSEPIRSAIRVFLGALQAGHIDIQTGNNVLRIMAELEQNLSGKKIIVEEYDWNLLRRYLTVKKEELHNVPKYIHPSKKALFIDDECLVSGWAECLKAILHGKDIKLVTEPSLTSALALLKHDGEEDKTYEFSFILLDFFLGENQPNGLEALRLIREKQFLIPVIMFTAMDNSQVTKLCIQLGAQGYFVKSLQEDRNSLDYYTKFIEVIEDIEKQKPRADEVQLWRKFVRIENQLNALDNHEIPKLSANNTMFYEGASDCLRKAFYFLFSIRGEVNDYRAMRLLGNYRATLARECIVYAVSAMYRMLVYRIGTDPKKTVGFLIDECIQNRYLNDNFEKFKKHWSLKRGFGRHNFLIEERNKISFNSSIGCISHVLEFAENYLKIPDIESIMGKIPMKITVNIDNNEIDEDRQLLKQATNNQQLINNHHTSAHMGAIGLDKGMYLKHGGDRNKLDESERKNTNIDQWLQNELNALITVKKTKKYHIILIDDRPTEDGWQKSLEYFFGSIGYRDMLKVYGKEEIINGLDIENIPAADLILLDLYIPGHEDNKPSPENGLNLLDKIKKSHFSRPVIMLTASNEARQVLRSFRRGALDYFIKGIPANNTDEALAHYDDFKKVIEKALKKGVESPEQFIWQEIQNFENSGALADFKPDYEKQIMEAWDLDDKLPVSSQIHSDICTLLKKAYYWFTIDQQKFEQWKIKRLFYIGKDPNGHRIRSIFWYCGMAVEIYLKLWILVEPNIKLDITANTGGEILNYAKRLPTNLKNDAREIWKARDKALTDLVLSDINNDKCTKYLQNTVNFLMKMRICLQPLLQNRHCKK